MPATKEQLLTLTSCIKEPTFVMVYMESDAKMRKTGNPFNDKTIIKRSQIAGYIGKNHSEEMKKSAEERGEVYEPKPRTWGQLINPCVIEHKSNYYLQIFVDTLIISEYFEITDSGEKRIEYEEIAEWLTPSPPVSVRDIKFENIQKLVVEINWSFN